MGAKLDCEAWRSAAGSISKFLGTLDISQNCRWSHAYYENTVHEAIRYFDVKSVCELGGGRNPLLSAEFVAKKGLRYVVNDISQTELHRGPAWIDGEAFDISAVSISSDLHNQFQFVFSHMLMEHVTDGEAAYRNIYKLLQPGGVFFNFHPVLYHPALVFNWLTPEWLSKRLLVRLRPERHDEGYPKFPAKYSFCVIGSRTAQMLRNTGFQEVALVPFYGTEYLDRIPSLQWLEDRFSSYARRNGLHLLASKSYTFGRK